MTLTVQANPRSRRLRSHRAGRIWAAAGLAGFVALVMLGPLLWQSDPSAQDYSSILKPPSFVHPLGSDSLGRDVLSRIFAGASTSLSVAAIVFLISLLVGVPLGAVAGYTRGPIETVINRVVDFFFTIPPFFFILAAVALFGANTLVSALIIGLTLWPSVTRLVRADFLTVKEREFVDAARVGGSSGFHIMSFEILPNAVHTGIVQCTLNAARGVLIIAGLGFLGLGDPQSVDWGSMVSEALKSSTSGWWALLFPGFAVMILVALLNIFGDSFSSVDEASG